MDSYSVHAMGANEPQTLMEIAGFPHWENVFSNILAFLLNTEEVHGFRHLFIRSIMAVYSSRCPGGWPKKGLELVDLTITVQARNGKSWNATVTEVVERSRNRFLVRTQ